MKIIPTTFAMLGLGALGAACSMSDEEPKPAVPAALPQVTARSAIEKVAKATCDRQEECGEIGETKRFSSRQHCLSTTREELTRDLGRDEDCKNGVSNEDLGECLTEVRDAKCEGVRSMLDSWRTSMECGSNELCMD
ncbi:MAG: hypothetical protein HOW73_48630 [Polyangiaceae bacterium]|nr:hypothetical protein [Polyangiaceae bacterium]